MQDTSSADVLREILHIAGYKGDTEKFIQDFFTSCANNALYELMTSLPEEEQKAFQIRLAGLTGQDEAIDELKKKFNTEQYAAAFGNATKANLEDFINMLYPTLSDTQQQDLSDYLQTQNME